MKLIKKELINLPNKNNLTKKKFLNGFLNKIN